MDWMYNQPQVNEEDYLMGKKVDKAIMEHQETKVNTNKTVGYKVLVKVLGHLSLQAFYNLYD